MRLPHPTAAAVAIVSTGLLLVTGCTRAQPEAPGAASASGPVEVELAQVRRGSIASSVELTGTLIPIRATTIVSEMDGIIQSFPLSERSIHLSDGAGSQSVPLGLDIGHEVKQGDVLVQLDPTDLQLAVDLATANLDLSKCDLENLLAWRRDEEVRQARAQLQEADAAVELAKADFERAEELRRTRAISQSEHDALEMTFHTAEAAKARAEAALEMATAGPTPQQVAVAKARVAAAQAEVALRAENLDKATIRAPYDGVVTERFVDVGDRITALPRVEILELIDPRVLFAQVAVPERYQGRLTLEAAAEVHVPGTDQAVAGRVDLVNAKIDPATRTFRVRVTVDNRRRQLRAGGFVEVTLPIATARDALVVPADAVALDEGRHTAMVYQDGTVCRREIAVGIANREEVEVLSGLEAGEQVAVGDTSLLADGLPVRVRTPSPVAAAESRDRAPSGPRRPGDVEAAGAAAPAATVRGPSVPVVGNAHPSANAGRVVP